MPLKSDRIRQNMRMTLFFLLVIAWGGISLPAYAAPLNKDSLCIEALLAVDADQYTSLKERRKFYKKADHLFTACGYEVRWLNVAFKTVRILELAHSKFGGAFAHTNAEIRAFINHGNKIILHDMLGKTRDMWREGRVLKGEEALRWDAQMLSDEQALIDQAYENLSSESQAILDKNLKGWASRNLLGNPKFEGYILNQEDRWVFGMDKMDYSVTKNLMPKPNSDWKMVNLIITGKAKKKLIIQAK